MPRVSIIMGIYNCGKTLGEAIDSLLAQTYTDWKLIMCDDGSVDDTYSIAQQYVQQYPDKMVLLKNEKNMGLNYTLNHCLSVADGELIARMDGDDISVPERFEREVEFLDCHPQYSIVSSCMHYFDENGIFRTGKGTGEPSIESIARTTPFCHAACMVRAEAYKAVDGYSVDEKRLRVEDWDLWVRMYERGYRGYMLDEPLYMMRDDRNAYARRKFKYRINEARVAISAIRKLKLSKKNYIWVLRPIAVGMMPKFLYDRLHRIKVH